MQENEKVQFSINFAGVNIGVKSIFESTKTLCKDYYTDNAPDFSVELTEDDIDRMREMNQNTPVNFSREYLESLALHKAVSDILPQYDRILFHSSAICMDGEAILFTALSGTGKSTHSKLWKKLYGDKVSYINDDKPFVGIEDGVIKVFGSPWMGKHRRGKNASAPIKAIGIIVRDEKNFVEKVRPVEAFSTLLTQSNRPADKKMIAKTIDILKKIAETVPIYNIHCNMEDEAARISHDEIFGN